MGLRVKRHLAVHVTSGPAACQKRLERLVRRTAIKWTKNPQMHLKILVSKALSGTSGPHSGGWQPPTFLMPRHPSPLPSTCKPPVFTHSAPSCQAPTRALQNAWFCRTPNHTPRSATPSTPTAKHPLLQYPHLCQAPTHAPRSQWFRRRLYLSRTAGAAPRPQGWQSPSFAAPPQTRPPVRRRG